MKLENLQQENIHKATDTMNTRREVMKMKVTLYQCHWNIIRCARIYCESSNIHGYNIYIK